MRVEKIKESERGKEGERKERTRGRRETHFVPGLQQHLLRLEVRASDELQWAVQARQGRCDGEEERGGRERGQLEEERRVGLAKSST